MLKKARVKKLAAFLTAAALICTIFFVLKGSGNTVIPQFENVMFELSDTPAEKGYREIREGYTLPAYKGEPVAAKWRQPDNAHIEETVYAGRKAAYITAGKTETYSVELPQSALYGITVEYFDDNESVQPPKLSFEIDSAVAFAEARNQIMLSKWDFPGKVQLDRYGNQITPESKKVMEWNTAHVRDGDGISQGALLFQLEKGVHTLSVTCEQGSLAVGEIHFIAVPEPEYSEGGQAQGNQLIVLPGEDIAYKNDSTVRPTGQYNTALAPYSPSALPLNMLDGNSFKTGGQSVTYSFYVKREGYYNICFRYCQSVRIDFPVFRNIYVDDTIPTGAFRNVAFPYTRSYKNLTVGGSDDRTEGVFLKAGDHTLTLEVTLEPIAGVLDEITELSRQINALSLEVMKITGNNANKYRDFDLDEFIPNLRDNLLTWASRTEKLYRQLQEINGSTGEIGAFSSLQVCKKQLISLAENPNKLPLRIKELSGESSVLQYLADVMLTLYDNPISLDESYVYQEDAVLPGRMNIFGRIWESAKRFVYSFTRKDYETGKSVAVQSEKANLQVWVSRARLYTEIIQKMADTAAEGALNGTGVDISLMPDAQKLVLANAAGSLPDVALGLNSSLPFELAIRGSLQDMTAYSDWNDVAERFNPALLTVGAIGDSRYCLPETTNFYMLFYRRDILNGMGLTVPNTMDEVKTMLPFLRSRGMNYFSHISGSISFKPFAATLPVIYQKGGRVYGSTADELLLDSDVTLDAIEEMVEYFAVYGMKFEVSNFYQHFRDGTLPIGVSDFGTYNLLLNSAPEIAGLWDIAPVPGYVNSKGEVQRWMTGAAENAVIFKSGGSDRRAWEFVKWWTYEETQSSFAQTLQTAYGKEYLWPTANLGAFARLPWNERHKQTIIEQMKWTFELPRVPGNYMTERELSNAMMSVVLKRENIRTAVGTASRNIRAEIKRKLEEFGYGGGENKYILPPAAQESVP